MTMLVLDATAIDALATPADDAGVRVRAAMRAAEQLNQAVVVPAVILAELYRGPRHNQAVDAMLSRETGIDVRDTDRPLARLVGGVLASAGASSDDLADTHCVATAVETGRGAVLTGDEDDLTRLAAAYPNVTILPI